MLDFRIHTFIIVCRHMNFTKAAKELHITQPTVTQHIQYLEELYQTRLFLYQNRKLTMTEAGQELLRASLAMSNDETILKERIQNLEKKRSSLYFGATLTIGEFIFPKQLNRMIETHPEMNIHMTVENTQALLDMIDQGKLEFAAVEGFFPKADYDFHVFATVPFLAVCKSGLPISGKKQKLEQLLDQRLLVREEGSGSRDILEHYLADRNLEIKDFKHRTEVNNYSALKYLTASGKGITFVYRSAVEEELEKGILSLVPIENMQISHEFTFVWRKGSIYREEYLHYFEELSCLTSTRSFPG